MNATTSRYYYGMMKNPKCIRTTIDSSHPREYVGVYHNESERPYIALFRAPSEAMPVRASIERIGSFDPRNAYVECDDAPVLQFTPTIKTISTIQTSPKKATRFVSESTIRMESCLDKTYHAYFKIGRWSRPPKDTSIVLDPISESDIVSILERGVGVAMMWKLVTSSRHHIRFECRLMEPTNTVTPHILETPWRL